MGTQEPFEFGSLVNQIYKDLTNEGFNPDSKTIMDTLIWLIQHNKL